MNKMNNKDLTSGEVFEIGMALKASIEELQLRLEKSRELDIPSNVTYYGSRLRRVLHLVEVFENTYGEKWD